jgi:hypothetical protein
MTLTKAQRIYLKLALRDGLSPDAIMPGSSHRCVARLVECGLMEQRVADFDIKFFVTEAGRTALSHGQQAQTEG